MKIKTIGDIHGSTLWEDIKSEIDTLDLIIFLGDYVDSFDISNKRIFDNLVNIINFKKEYPDKVVLLVGNHDVMYALAPAHVNNPYWCSGYRPDMHVDLYELFQENKDLFQLAYQYKNYLWTHAGVHQGWWDCDYPFAKEDLSDIAVQLNRSFDCRLKEIFQVGWYRGGIYDVGGPLWVDRRKSIRKPLRGLHQIVGHSRVDKIQTFDVDDNTSITFCDCLQSNNPEFYELNIE